MPTLRFHAVPTEKLYSVSESLLRELMDIYQVPADHITLEVIDSRFIIEGKLSEGYPMIEVCAFKRPAEIQDAVAKSVHKHLLQAGFSESELYFVYPEPRDYYGNGNHY